MTREKPILFKAPMVCAILNDRKTQTRRKIDPQPLKNCVKVLPHGDEFLQIVRDATGMEYTCGDGHLRLKPRYQVGDVLWVKETWRPSLIYSNDGGGCIVHYAADRVRSGLMVPPLNWKLPKAALRGNISSLFMPRWASRITLEVTEVRGERVRDISPQDCIAEGIQAITHKPDAPIETGTPPRGFYYSAWGCWSANPDAPDPYGDYLEHEEAQIVAAYERLWYSINGPGSFWLDWCWVYTFKVLDVAAKAVQP